MTDGHREPSGEGRPASVVDRSFGSSRPGERLVYTRGQ